MKPGDTIIPAMIGRHKRWLIAALAALVLAAGWYLTTRPRSRVLEGQDHVVGFSADGSVLATTGRDGVGYLWDPETGQIRDELAGKVVGLTFPFSPDGRYHLASAPVISPISVATADLPYVKDKLIAQFENQANTSPLAAVTETKSKREVFEFHLDSFNTFRARLLGFTPNGKFFFSQRVQADSSLRDTSCVWSLPDGRKLYDQYSYLLAISGDGEKLASASGEIIKGTQRHFLDIVRVNDGKTELAFEPAPFSSQGTAFSADGRRVLQIGSRSMGWGVAALFDLETNKQAIVERMPLLIGFGGPVVPRFIHGDQLVEVQRLVPRFQWVTVCTATTEDFRIVWDARSISSNKAWCFREEYAQGKQTVLKVFRVSPEVAAKTKGQDPAPTYEFTFDSLLYPRQTAVSDDGRIVVMACRRSDLMVVDMIDKEVLLQKTFDPSWIWGIYLSPNGRLTASTVQTGERSEVHLMTIPGI